MKVFDLILRGRFSLISKRNFVKEAKVAPFPCDVSEHSADHHGDSIIGVSI